MRVIKEFSFDSAHRLLGYTGKCGYLHGHTWKVLIGMEGEIKKDCQERGMVRDFDEIKKDIQPIIDDLDHSVLLEQGDPLIDILPETDAKVIVFPFRVTSENLAEWFLTRFDFIDYVKIYETSTSSAEKSRER